MAEMTRVVWTGGREMAGALRRMNDNVAYGSRVGVQRTAMALVKQAKINATNPPPRLGMTAGRDPGTGPAVVSGRLRNSIVITEQGPTGKWGYQATVAPTVKYARRLELGFSGADSLGRVYDQPAYPFFGPAYRFVMSVVAQRQFEMAWAEALRR